MSNLLNTAAPTAACRPTSARRNPSCRARLRVAWGPWPARRNCHDLDSGRTTPTAGVSPRAMEDSPLIQGTDRVGPPPPPQIALWPLPRASPLSSPALRASGWHVSLAVRLSVILTVPLVVSVMAVSGTHCRWSRERCRCTAPVARGRNHTVSVTLRGPTAAFLLLPLTLASLPPATGLQSFATCGRSRTWHTCARCFANASATTVAKAREPSRKSMRPRWKRASVGAEVVQFMFHIARRRAATLGLMVPRQLHGRLVHRRHSTLTWSLHPLLQRVTLTHRTR